MNVLLVGGTGFIGKHLRRALVESGHEVALAIRQNSRTVVPPNNIIKTLTINPEQEISLGDISADAIINLAGIIREFPSKGITFRKTHFEVTQNLVEFAKKNGIRGFLLMSALGVGLDATGEYMRSKYEAEEYVRNSSLKWTIFRPSVVFGPGDHIVTLFSTLIRKMPVIGVIGDGEYKLQPVYVDDICAGFVKALTDSAAAGRIFEIGGPEIITFNNILDIVGEVVGKRRVRKIHIPAGLMKLVSSILKGAAQFPITPEQIDLLLKGSCANDNSYYEFLGHTPIPFKQGIAGYLKR